MFKLIKMLLLVDLYSLLLGGCRWWGLGLPPSSLMNTHMLILSYECPGLRPIHFQPAFLRLLHLPFVSGLFAFLTFVYITFPLNFCLAVQLSVWSLMSSSPLLAFSLIFVFSCLLSLPARPNLFKYLVHSVNTILSYWHEYRWNRFEIIFFSYLLLITTSWLRLRQSS